MVTASGMWRNGISPSARSIEMQVLRLRCASLRMTAKGGASGDLSQVPKCEGPGAPRLSNGLTSFSKGVTAPEADPAGAARGLMIAAEARGAWAWAHPASWTG